MGGRKEKNCEQLFECRKKLRLIGALRKMWLDDPEWLNEEVKKTLSETFPRRREPHFTWRTSEESEGSLLARKKLCDQKDGLKRKTKLKSETGSGRTGHSGNGTTTEQTACSPPIPTTWIRRGKMREGPSRDRKQAFFFFAGFSSCTGSNLGSRVQRTPL